jgi:ribosome-associated protein
MGDEVVVTAKKFGMPPIGIEGEKDAEWMLVDLGDTVVHLMLPRIREFYGLERLWTLAEESRAAAWTA